MQTKLEVEFNSGSLVRIKEVVNGWYEKLMVEWNGLEHVELWPKSFPIFYFNTIFPWCLVVSSNFYLYQILKGFIYPLSSVYRSTTSVSVFKLYLPEWKKKKNLAKIILFCSFVSIRVHNGDREVFSGNISLPPLAKSIAGKKSDRERIVNEHLPVRLYWAGFPRLPEEAAISPQCFNKPFQALSSRKPVNSRLVGSISLLPSFLNKLILKMRWTKALGLMKLRTYFK